MQKLAIIGTGITGLGAAYLLQNNYEITVYEKNSYAGGHSRTIEVANTPVDTGFIVFNKHNYPNLTALFEKLDIEIAKSSMSFGVANKTLEYGTENIAGLFASKRNLYQPKFYKMLLDIIKFNSEAKKYIAQKPLASTATMLQELKLGTWFKDYYLLAMAAAIWSSPKQQILKFPASTLINFFNNHGLLTINEQPQWYTVKGGSKEYVKQITKDFTDKIRLKSSIIQIERLSDGALLTDENGRQEQFDQVVICCHSDQALNLLTNPTQAEQDILGAIKYQNNKVVTHTDNLFMPKNKNAWASWVYLGDANQLSLTYWMNNLQPLTSEQDIFVTLNPNTMPAAEHILDTHEFSHPVFDQAAISAQTKIDSIQGINGIWYAGAWQRYGFHEDGLASAVKVAKALGAHIPWT